MVPTCSLKKSLVGPGILTIINSFFSISPIPSSLTHVMVQILVKKKQKQTDPERFKLPNYKFVQLSHFEKNVSVRFQVNTQHSTSFSERPARLKKLCHPLLLYPLAPYGANETYSLSISTLI